MSSRQIEAVRIGEETAAAFGVPAAVHEADHIFSFLAAHPLYQGEGVALRHYLENGRQSADHLNNLLAEFGIPKDATILEFASGYGCVTRHLKVVMPSARIVPCDIHPQALDFIRDALGIDGVVSRTVPEAASFGATFDVVFALSFFSHMPKRTWGRWLGKLAASVRPGGLIIFTTHGWKSSAMMSFPPLDEDGFWYAPSSEQADLDVSDYGTTVTALRFTWSQIASLPEVRLVKFREGFWWGHQDLFVLQRNEPAAAG